jgi:YlqD protein
METSNQSLLLKRPITLKVVVTPRWKEEVQQQLQTQLNELDGQFHQLDMQGQRMITEIQKQSIQPPGPEVTQQIEGIQVQVNQRKSELLDQKNQILQNLQQVQMLEPEQEVVQGQLDSFCRIELGDNLVRKMQIEILMRDGVVEEIRGDI